MNGWRLYLSPVVDCWDGMPVSWRTSARPDSAPCDGSLEDALDAVDALPGPRGAVVGHSDGGSCCGSRPWRAICGRRGAARSMSRKAACPDNARAEGLFGTLKREFPRARDWAGVGREEFAREPGRWLGWHVHGRLKAFREGGRTAYMTIAEHRRLHGYALA